MLNQNNIRQVDITYTVILYYNAQQLGLQLTVAIDTTRTTTANV